MVPVNGTYASRDTQRQQLMSALCSLCDKSKNWDTAPAAKNRSVYVKHISETVFERRSISMAMKSADHSKQVKKRALLLLLIQ